MHAMISATLALAAFGLAGHASAQTPAEFYRGKTLTLVTGTAGAGGYDLAARIVGEHVRRHLPGAPATIIQAMPGASHVRATEYIAAIAPREGLVLGFVQPYVVLNKLLNPDARYEPAALAWIGRLLPLNQIGFSWRGSGVNNIEDAKRRQIIMGSAGATGPAATVPWALNRMIGTKFRVVRGYVDDTAEFLALERGEIEGMGSANYGALARRPGFVDQNRVMPLYTIANQRYARLPDTPALTELTTNENDLRVLRVLGAMPAIGLTIVAPPGVPAERVAALRRASAEMAVDPAFVADMMKSELEPEPLGGEELAALVSKTMEASPGTLEALRKYTAPID